MADAKRDENRVPVLTALLNSDGSTPVGISVDPTFHAINVSDNTTGSDLSGDDAKRDGNRVPVAMGVSETDGVTPVPVYADASGFLLIDST